MAENKLKKTVTSQTQTRLRRKKRKNTQIAFASETERTNLYNILNAMIDGVYIVDKQHNIQYVNAILVKDFGHYEGKKCYQYFHDRSKKCPWCKNRDVWAGKTVRWEWSSSKNGRTYDLIDTPVTLPDGNDGKLEIFRDITERKHVEDKLRERVKELNCLYAISELVEKPDVSLDEILQGTVSAISPSWQYPEITCARITLDDREFKTENFRKTRWKQNSHITVHGKRSGAVEVCYLRKRPESDEGPFLKEERRLLNVVAERLGRIIERKKAEEELRLQSAITVNMNEAVYLVGGDDGIIRYTNPKFEEIFGYDPGEMLGKHVSIVNAPTDIHPIKTAKKIMGILKRTGKWHGEVRNIKKDGTLFWCHANVIAFNHLKYGKAMISVHTDITEQKKAEQDLRRSEQNLAVTIDSIGDAVIATDGTGSVTRINPVAEALTGWPLNEARGRPLSEIFHIINEETRKEAENPVEKVLREGKVMGLANHTVLVSRDGTERPIGDSAAPIIDRHGGEILGIVLVFRDLSREKQAQQALREREEIKMSLEQKELLLKEVHHRIKNNLQVVSSLLDMKSMRTEDRAAKLLLADARSKMHTMALIHAQLYRSEQFDQIQVKLHVDELINYVIQIFGTRIRIIPSIDEALFVPLYTAVPLGFVLNELISNAVRHAFPGREEGSVMVTAKKLKDNRLSLSVTDNGIGLPRDIDINTAETMGLKLVRELVLHQMHGSIDVKRRKGTQFTIQCEMQFREKDTE